MSGSTPPPNAAGSGSGADPSMEDILASIRRILNEDEVAPANPDGAHPEPAATAGVEPAQPNAGGPGRVDDDGVLVLDEGMLVTPPPSPPVSQPEPAPAEVAVVPPPPPPAVPAPSAGLLAPESAAAAASSVDTLLRTLSAERTTQVYRGGPTIEDLVREELRPLLKVWLDEHLPPLVERAVRREIERVTGRATP